MLSVELQYQRTGLCNRARTSSIAYNRILQTRARQPAPALSNVNMGQPTEPQSQLPLVTCFSALLQLTCSIFHRAPLLGRAPCCREDMHRRCAGKQDILRCIYSSGDVGAARVRVFVCACVWVRVKNRVVQLQSTKLQLSSTPNPCAACVTTHEKQSHVTRHTQRILRQQAHH